MLTLLGFALRLVIGMLLRVWLGQVPKRIGQGAQTQTSVPCLGGVPLSACAKHRVRHLDRPQPSDSMARLHEALHSKYP